MTDKLTNNVDDIEHKQTLNKYTNKDLLNSDVSEKVKNNSTRF